MIYVHSLDDISKTMDNRYQTCKCNEPDHAINHLIERETGIYINTCLALIDDQQINNEYVKENVISSVESYVYGHKNKKSIIPSRDIPKITKLMLDIGKNIDESANKAITDMKGAIDNAPISKREFLVYRGLHKRLEYKVGDLFNHKSFLYTSFHKRYAMKYMDDLTKCYATGNFDNSQNKGLDKGTLLKITVPMGTSYLEFPNDLNFLDCPKSELIFNPSQLLVTASEIIHTESNGHRTVDCYLLLSLTIT